ncbi:YhjD/YihY/BrkB family envelope integrity protein [Spirillospora sp. NPDC047279]|uniref:YhjD/YihY/BrkB family envelope integrity protein n=1 Tax=Spirillospora sp. NPDC047279 TaxID=3155478 RepID=UPI0034111A89
MAPRRLSGRVAAWTARAERTRDALLERPLVRQGHDAYQRYYTLGMHHVAGSVTYFGVLTLFPLLALLLAAAASVVTAHPSLRETGTQAVAETFGVPVDLQGRYLSAQARASVQAALATIGVTGFVYAGRLWVDAYRRAFRVVWGPGEPSAGPGYVWRYVRDVLVFTVIAAAVTVLVVLGLLATGGPYRVFAVNGHGLAGWAVAAARAGAVAATAAWGFLLCSALYHRLGRAPRTPAVRWAAALAGASLAAMMIGGLLLLKHAFAEPTYGIVVAMLGLMLWVSAAVRITLALGMWARTAAPARHDDR